MLDADGVAPEPDAVAGALGVGAGARLAGTGVALATPWPAVHAVASRPATTTTAAIGDADHVSERFMFTPPVAESALSSR